MDTVPTLVGVYSCVGIVWFEFYKINGAKWRILHPKSPPVRAAELKGFTVFDVRFVNFYKPKEMQRRFHLTFIGTIAS